MPIDPEEQALAELASIAGEETPKPTEEGGRGFGESLYGRTVGRTASALDRAMGGLPSTLAGAAGAASAGDEAGVQRALEEGGSTSERLKDVGLGLLELYFAGKAPGAMAATSTAGAATEAATGSETAGDVAEIGTGVARPATAVAKGVVKGAKRIFGKPPTLEMTTKGLGAEKTAQQVGRELQAPKAGARGVTTAVSKEASGMYKEAQAAAKAAKLHVPATDKTIQGAAKAALKEAKESGRPLSGPARRSVHNIIKAGRGPKPKLVTPSGKAPKAPPRDMPVDELIDLQSNLRREISRLRPEDPGRRALIQLSVAIDDSMEKAAKAVPEVSRKLAAGRKYYRETTLPTRRTMSKVTAAETPESATRVLTAGKTPTRFERYAAKAKPGEVENVRSAYFNDMIQSAREGDKVNLRKLAVAIEKAEATGQLSKMSNTTARRQTIKAIRKAADIQKAAGKAPLVGGGAGATSGWLGIATGFTIGRIVQASMQNEATSRAFLRLMSARKGTPGWKSAAKALEKSLKTAAPAGRPIVGISQEEK